MMNELFFGIMLVIVLYLFGRLAYPDFDDHVPIVPEPNNMLPYAKESVALSDWEKAVFGDEEE